MDAAAATVAGLIVIGERHPQAVHRRENVVGREAVVGIAMVEEILSGLRYREGLAGGILNEPGGGRGQQPVDAVRIGEVHSVGRLRRAVSAEQILPVEGRAAVVDQGIEDLLGLRGHRGPLGGRERGRGALGGQRPGLIQQGHGVLHDLRRGVDFAFDVIQIAGHLRDPADIGLELQYVPHRRGIIRRFADPDAGSELGLGLGHAVLERRQVVQELARAPDLRFAAY